MLVKQKLANLEKLGPKKVKEEVVNSVVNVLLNYRVQSAPNSSPSQLVIPESLRLMPIYILSGLKTHALRLLSSSRQLDNKVFQAIRLMGNSFTKMAYMFYPRIYNITEVTELPGQQDYQGGTNMSWGIFTDDSQQTMVKPKVV